MLYVALAGQLVLVAGAFRLETRTSSDQRRSAVRGALVWSAAWLALGLLPTLWFGLFDSPHAAGAYAAVYLIERALSLDNVFVFRSEEHTSELQSLRHLGCRLLLEKEILCGGTRGGGIGSPGVCSYARSRCGW